MSSSPLQEILCCLAQPAAGNPTQYMMEKCFPSVEFDGRYLTLEVAPDQIGNAVAGMRAMGFCGATIADPHKMAVLDHLDALGETAKLAGVVNCVRRDADGQYVGENTEGLGCLAALQRVIDLKGKQVVLLGAGQAGRAIAVELAGAGVSDVTVVSRTADRGQALADLVNDRLKVSAMFIPWSGQYEVASGTDIVVNATNIGVAEGCKNAVPVQIESLSAETLVADLRIDPPQTGFLRAAAEHGCAVVDGLQMYVELTGACFCHWTGVDPDLDAMREALEEFLEL